MMRPPAENHISFSVTHLEARAPGVSTPAQWVAWANGSHASETGSEPTLQQMQPLLRRHAGRLGRYALSAAYDALGDQTSVPVVFSSRYGEVSRSVELLTALAANEELSPATFGLSVHNAIPGLFSMARKDTANSISLAAGDEIAEFGVVEACGLLADGAEQVLLVVADVPLPPIYASFADTNDIPFGWACVLKPAQNSVHDSVVNLQWTEEYSPRPMSANAPALPASGALAALPVLQGTRREFLRTTKARTWRWYRNG